MNPRKEGTIPARAGETTQLILPSSRQRDHPRSRGGDTAATLEVPFEMGPSPLARGRQDQHPPCRWRGGTIPARAGETHHSSPFARDPWDHPRSRGGDLLPAPPGRPLPGPSPLARGRLSKKTDTRPNLGTIPARAGETYYYVGLDEVIGDHPRSRGGDFTERVLAEFDRGPSPLARGRLLSAVLADLIFGTIPARAGETPEPPRPMIGRRDHPRSRGGDPFICAVRIEKPGPSPLARGRRYCSRLNRSITGTIPARAGETEIRHPAAGAITDHPRSRGGDCTL